MVAMPVIVEEGLHPNGMDLVVGEHHSNGFAKAKAAGQQIVKVVDIGDDFAVAGCRLDLAWDAEKENLCVLLVLDAGKNSRLVGLQPVTTILAELARIKVADLKTAIAEAVAPKAPEQPV